jgi:hypothetical protein
MPHPLEVANAADNRPAVYNSSQHDTDRPGQWVRDLTRALGFLSGP